MVTVAFCYRIETRSVHRRVMFANCAVAPIILCASAPSSFRGLVIENALSMFSKVSNIGREVMGLLFAFRALEPKLSTGIPAVANLRAVVRLTVVEVCLCVLFYSALICCLTVMHTSDLYSSQFYDNKLTSNPLKYLHSDRYFSLIILQITRDRRK